MPRVQSRTGLVATARTIASGASSEGRRLRYAVTRLGRFSAMVVALQPVVVRGHPGCIPEFPR